MSFIPPKGFWQWTAFFSPAIVNVLAAYQGPRIGFVLFGEPQEKGDYWAEASLGRDSLILVGSVILGVAMCFVLGSWFARRSGAWLAGNSAGPNDRAGFGAFIYGFALVVINFTISFGGCAIADSVGCGP